jgi:hypothetical protein
MARPSLPLSWRPQVSWVYDGYGVAGFFYSDQGDFRLQILRKMVYARTMYFPSIMHRPSATLVYQTPDTEPILSLQVARALVLDRLQLVILDYPLPARLPYYQGWPAS